MNRRPFVVLALLLLAPLALPLAAAAGGTAAPGQGGGDRAPASPAAGVAPIQRQLSQRNAEVDRLARDVAAQEARSREAARRLAEQDRALERLRRELRELAPGHGARPSGS